ncbi:MAG: tripartite tricarboxylate transporter TctB family protein [Deltaproteobacteria bacterium]|nr:tripartite tricarboxylate transporter TctB family protein [Deltaproteobacteria bacterium]
MKHGDRIAAIFFLVLSLFVCGHAVQIGIGSLQEPGPGLLVFGAGAGIGLLALWLLIHSLISKQSRCDGAAEGSPLGKGRFLLLCLSLFLFALAAPRLGFLISTFLFATFLFRLVQPEPWWRSLLTAALITAGDYLLFVLWLGLSLPQGILPW